MIEDLRKEIKLHDICNLLPDWVQEDNVILAGIRGSHAHGTYISPAEEHGTDDVDLFVVTTQPVDWYLGLMSLSKKRGKHAETHGDEIDIKVYDVKKFGHLLRKGNPNVHNWLWAPEDCYLFVSDAGQLLIDRRADFLSARILNSIHGYARGQLHRMTHDNRTGFLGEKRKALIEKYGYDCKNASHAIRLMWMGISLGFSQVIQVRWEHHKAGLLKSIKSGDYTLQQIRDMVDFYMPVLERASKIGRRKLPDEADLDLCNRHITYAVWLNHTRAVNDDLVHE